MATAAALFSHLRRARHSSSLSLSLLSLPRVLSSHLPSPSPPRPPLSGSSKPPSQPRPANLAIFGARAFSTHFPGDREPDSDSFRADSEVDSELLKAIADSALAVTGGGGGVEDSAAFPVRAVISLLDAYHDVSGFPWWITIASSTLALRLVLLFPLVFTLHKAKRIGEFSPKLPPPFPPPFSGKSYIKQFVFFNTKRKAVGCPSYLWLVVPLITQIPCFFLWMISIRKMSLDGHPGFSSGGAMWFQNLTELSHGYSGFIFPFLIAGLHYINVQITFLKPVVKETSDIFDLLSKLYKRYLDFLTLPIAYIGFCIPQHSFSMLAVLFQLLSLVGSLVYWVTNSSLTLIQHFALRHPIVLAKLGLQDKNSQKAASEEIVDSKISGLDSQGLQENSPAAALDSPEKWHKISIEEMSPKQLTALAIPFLNSDDKESAIPLLRKALEKDPEYVRALVMLGQVLLLKQINAEANECFERAISKLSQDGHPTDEEDLGLLILSSQWAGIACERQGKRAEGRAHLERIAKMEEPEDDACKSYYFKGLLLLASTLYNEGEKDEAAKYLRLLVAYNPAYEGFLKQCEQGDVDIVTDLANSRREL